MTIKSTVAAIREAFPTEGDWRDKRVGSALEKHGAPLRCNTHVPRQTGPSHALRELNERAEAAK